MRLKSLVLPTAAITIGLSLPVRPANAVQAGSAAQTHQGPLSPEQELGNLTRSLQLTTEQQGRLRPVLVERREQLVQIHNDRTLSREGKGAKMKALDESANQKVLAVLNQDQKAKYQAMIDQRKAALARRQAGARAR